MGGVSFASVGVPVTGMMWWVSYTSMGEEGAGGAVGEGEGGKVMVVCTVGLRVWLLCTPFEREGCSRGVAADEASGSAGRQSSPSPGGGKGGVPSGDWLLH